MHFTATKYEIAVIVHANDIWRENTSLIMDVNTLFLCVVNVSCIIVGVFLNSVVIISLWRSTQLRKKLCYFMIRVLSCFDLAVVAVNHPILITSAILWPRRRFYKELEIVAPIVTIEVAGLSLFALLMLNVERFLAISYPFLHQSVVTEARVKICLVFWIIMQVGMSPLLHFYETTKNALITVYVFVLLCVFVYSNYKILIIAKSKRKDERIARLGVETNTCQKRKKSMILNFKSISTCSLAVGCFFLCSLPQLVFSVWRIVTNTPWDDNQAVVFSFWCNTILFMNSTFNCLIFFWRNSVLRQEGMKIAKFFWTIRR